MMTVHLPSPTAFFVGHNSTMPSHTNSPNMSSSNPPSQQAVYAHPGGASFVINGQEPYAVSMPIAGESCK